MITFLGNNNTPASGEIKQMNAGRSILLKEKPKHGQFKEINLHLAQSLLSVLKQSREQVIFIQDIHNIPALRPMLANKKLTESLLGLGIKSYVIEAPCTPEMKEYCLQYNPKRRHRDPLPPQRIGPARFCDKDPSYAHAFRAMSKAGMKIVPADHPNTIFGPVPFPSEAEREAWITKTITNTVKDNSRAIVLFGKLHGQANLSPSKANVLGGMSAAERLVDQNISVLSVGLVSDSIK